MDSSVCLILLLVVVIGSVPFLVSIQRKYHRAAFLTQILFTCSRKADSRLSVT